MTPAIPISLNRWLVREDVVQVGDRILSHGNSPSIVDHIDEAARPDKMWTVTGVSKTEITSDTGIVHYLNGKYWFVVYRKPDSKLDINKFPHICPRCGHSAYVGAWEVEHLYASDCPVKRK